MSLKFILYAMVFITISGIPGLFSKSTDNWGQRVATAIMLMGSVLGLTGAMMGIFAHESPQFVFLWPTFANIYIGLDSLSSFFLVPVFLVGGLGSFYGLDYWKQSEHPLSARNLQLFWGLFVAGMVLLLIARDALPFILGWEFMALSAFFFVATEHEKKECRKSALVYIVSTHISTLILFGFFAFWKYATGSFQFLPINSSVVDPMVLNILFLLSFVGFGLKTGMMPFHFWLPSAHANAPTHVSAILSGVMIKMGIYGMIRIAFLLPTPPLYWGVLILVSGAISGIFGVVFALAQHDIKRLLAYHSVENIGIILMGFGLAMIGRAVGNPIWIALGMAGGLLHVWNHSTFKSLLFFGAGSVMHATGKRNLDILGGLSKKMPFTAFFFLVGAIAISGLPPLNGFISELFIYIGLFRPMANGDVGAFGLALFAPVLAMIGALAAACFVKVYASVFLGTERTKSTQPVHESSLYMLTPMAILALLCVIIGMTPQLVYPVIESVINQKHLLDIVPLNTISYIYLGLFISLGIVLGLVIIKTRKHKKSITWDCAYVAPTSRMQYTAASFGNNLTSMFGWILRPKEHKPKIEEIHPEYAILESHVNEVVLDRLLVPVFRRIQIIFAWFFRFQQGQSQSYILYILITVILLLATMLTF